MTETVENLTVNASKNLNVELTLRDALMDLAYPTLKTAEHKSLVPKKLHTNASITLAEETQKIVHVQKNVTPQPLLDVEMDLAKQIEFLADQPLNVTQPPQLDAQI